MVVTPALAPCSMELPQRENKQEHGYGGDQHGEDSTPGHRKCSVLS